MGSALSKIFEIIDEKGLNSLQTLCFMLETVPGGSAGGRVIVVRYIISTYLLPRDAATVR